MAGLYDRIRNVFTNEMRVPEMAPQGQPVDEAAIRAHQTAAVLANVQTAAIQSAVDLVASSVDDYRKVGQHVGATDILGRQAKGIEAVNGVLDRLREKHPTIGKSLDPKPFADMSRLDFNRIDEQVFEELIEQDERARTPRYEPEFEHGF